MCPVLQMSVLDAWLRFISHPGSSAGSMVSNAKCLLYRGGFGFHLSLSDASANGFVARMERERGVCCFLNIALSSSEARVVCSIRTG